MVMERRPATTTLLALTVPTGPPGRPKWLAGLLARYLAAAFVLVTLVLATGAARRAPSGPAWAHQRETVTVDGSGVLNAYARWALRATAWTTTAAIERQRDLHRADLLETAAARPAANGISAWRDQHRLALEGVTVLLLIALVAYGVLRSPPTRTWLTAALLLLGLTIAITKPATMVTAGAAPAAVVGETTMRGAATTDPFRPPDATVVPGAGPAEQRLATAYWDAFVGDPLSRMQTGGTVLAGARPEDKPGVLAFLRDRIGAVNDWAAGRRGWERAFMATAALAYALPFALGVSGLAMLGTCAQALALLLGLGALAALPLAVDPRRCRAVLRYWLLPLAGSLAVLAASALAAQLLMRAGELIHSADEYAGLLLAGSAVPVLATLLAGRRLTPLLRRAARPRRLELPGGVR
jgi:hypothetical protein